jgi:hypothetical protein
MFSLPVSREISLTLNKRIRALIDSFENKTAAMDIFKIEPRHNQGGIGYKVTHRSTLLSLAMLACCWEGRVSRLSKMPQKKDVGCKARTKMAKAHRTTQGLVDSSLTGVNCYEKWSGPIFTSIRKNFPHAPAISPNGLPLSSYTLGSNNSGLFKAAKAAKFINEMAVIVLEMLNVKEVMEGTYRRRSTGSGLARLILPLFHYLTFPRNFG